MAEVLKIVTDITPLGLAAMLAAIIYLLIRNRSQVQELSANHLSGLPEMMTLLTKIADSQERQEECGRQILNQLSTLDGYLRGRANGRQP